jgi:polar amino acid transport system substrate-binding protein
LSWGGSYVQKKVSWLSLAIMLLALTNLAYAAPLAEIQKRGKLIVAVKDNLQPLGFKDEQGNLQGLEIDIARRLAQEILGDSQAVVFVPVSNQDRLRVVLEGEVDLTIGSVTQTASRSRIVDFSPYYYLNGTGLITKNPTFEKLNRLSPLKIAILNNSDTIGSIKNALPNAQLIGVNSYQEAYELLENNLADIFAADKTILTGWVQQYPQYRILSQTFSVEPICVVMPRGLQHLDLRNLVNQAIVEWRINWLPERIKYWGLDN